MRKEELQNHLSPKDADYYLMKLGFYKKEKVDYNGVNPNNIPQPLYFDNWEIEFFTIKKGNVSSSDIAVFLEAKKTHSINIIKICGIIVTVLILLMLVILIRL